MKPIFTSILLASFLFTVQLFPVLAQQSQNTPQQTIPDSITEIPRAFQDTLISAQLIGSGAVSAYQLNGHILFVLSQKHFGKLILWYAEAVSLPAEAVSLSGIEIGRSVVTFERHDNRVMIRDHTSGLGKRAGRATQNTQPSYNKPQRLPIQVAINDSSKGPIIAVFPIIAEDDNGNILVDVTQTFTGDIESFTASRHIQSTGVVSVEVDPERSYISEVTVFHDNVNIRSHLTFLTKNPNDPSEMVQPLSIEVGHSFVLLPEIPMAARAFDKRVGFFSSEFVEYESHTGETVENRSIILRWRMEKSDPGAKVSTPVKPILFYIGRDVPDRWRPYIKAGIEQWQPVFEAAGFKNAIIARDAPSLEEDPTWSPQDARHSVIRWLAQARANAIGPNIYDPRSGEVLSAHIQIWPEVIGMFERYYYAVVGSLDPEAAKLPMSDTKRGELLQYIVAHEVGHAIGLRHNHLASTAYSVAQMRDPNFANVHGPNASIMAYGRFNQAAQPGDGVTRFLPILGPYDYFAINWGYGIHGNTPEGEREILERMATQSENDRRLTWAAGEIPQEKEAWMNDPRLQLENTGAERVEATRLAISNLLRSLEMLPSAVGDDTDLFRETVAEMLSQHIIFLESVATLVGGTINLPLSLDGPVYQLVTPAEQREAVHYLLDEGVRSLERYKDPLIITRIPPIGGIRAIESLQGALLETIFSGTKLARLDEQKVLYPSAYGAIELTEDVYAALWNDLSTVPRWRRALQSRFLDLCEKILNAELQADSSKMATAVLMQQGFSMPFASLVTASGSKTDFPAWARNTLPDLHDRLEKAAKTAPSRSDRYHFQTMAWRIEQI